MKTTQRYTSTQWIDILQQACLVLRIKNLKKIDRSSIILIIDPYEYDLHSPFVRQKSKRLFVKRLIHNQLDQKIEVHEFTTLF